MPDGWELSKGLNPLVNDALGDPDSDGVPNWQDLEPFNPAVGRPTITYSKPSGGAIF